MAFTAGVSRPKINTNNGDYKRIKNSFDRLLTIEDYDLPNHAILAYDDKGIKYRITVNQEVFLNNEAYFQKSDKDYSTVQFFGHKIDQKMKTSLPAGSKFVAHKSTVLSKDDGRGYKTTEIERVYDVKCPDPDKTFEGVFTASYRMEEGKARVSHIQHWNRNGINVNSSDDIEKLKDLMDEALSINGKKIGSQTVTVPTYGVQFRTLKATDRKFELDGSDKKVFEVVDTSIPFDWLTLEDENGNPIKDQAHMITGDEMVNYAEQYIEHISTHPDFQEYTDSLSIEICYYKVYPASKNDNMVLTKGIPDKDKNADKNPLYQLTHATSYVDLDNSDTGRLVGKNNAVRGIIQISENKPEKVNGKFEEVQVNWVSRLHAYSTRGHVHSFIRTYDDQKAEPHEKLKLKPNAKKEESYSNQNSNTGAEQSSTSSSVKATSNSLPPTPPQVNTDSFDPFADPVLENTSDTKKGLKFGPR